MFSEVSERWEEFKNNSDNSPNNQSFDEYSYAQILKEELLIKYKGLNLEDVIKGDVSKNNSGECFCISSTVKANFENNHNPEHHRDILLQNLKLIYGVGDLTEKSLKSLGYQTIENLVEYPRFSDKAKEILKLVEERDIKELFRLIRGRTSKSDPSILHLSLLQDIENFIFLDIETMGLFSRPIILIGLARIHEDKIYFKQIFARHTAEEKAILEDFIKDLDEKAVFATYNGDAFDIPYIEDRLHQYGLGKVLDLPDFDLLLFARRKWKGILPNCKLITVEKHLFGEGRNKDVPSALVPEFYETYLRTGNIGPIIPIIEHNREDLLTLIHIYFELCREY